MQTRREVGWAIIGSVLLLGQAYIERKADDISGAAHTQTNFNYLHTWTCTRFFAHTHHFGIHVVFVNSHPT